MAGRPPTQIDWKTVDRLLQAGCTGTQIAARLGIHADTLYRACQAVHKVGFAAYSAQKKAHGESFLHELQFALAMRQDRGMLIWLGKQRLNQGDRNNQVVVYKNPLDDLSDDEIEDELRKLSTDQ